MSEAGFYGRGRTRLRNVADPGLRAIALADVRAGDATDNACAGTSASVMPVSLPREARAALPSRLSTSSTQTSGCKADVAMRQACHPVLCEGNGRLGARHTPCTHDYRVTHRQQMKPLQFHSVGV
jgi:hypothetical protein